mmetsp:Transcript_10707/g.19645  ORF Transcript_10707/g.19645 Transcript_10707/m.19645 type:complete len:256 (+) Transcript_10707:285-1052(+)
MTTENGNEQPALPVIVIAGYGPSIGEATAKEFGTKGFRVACFGRNREKLEQGARRLRSMRNVTCDCFVVDCGNSKQVKTAIRQVQSRLGRITVIVWNAASYAGPDLLPTQHVEGDNDDDEDPTEILHQIVDVGCGGLLSSVQAAYKDLKVTSGTVLVTGGGLSTYDNQVDEIAVNNNWMGLAFCKSSQRKLAGLLHARLKPDGIMVGTVVISGPVRMGGGEHATDPEEVAQKFWEIHVSRSSSEIHLGSLEPLSR